MRQTHLHSNNAVNALNSWLEVARNREQKDYERQAAAAQNRRALLVASAVLVPIGLIGIAFYVRKSKPKKEDA